MNWIPCSERMPEEGVHVLVYIPGEQNDNKGCDVMSYVRFYGRGRNGALTWVDAQGDDSSSYGEEEFGITHWMPLPAPPSADFVPSG